MRPRWSAARDRVSVPSGATTALTVVPGVGHKLVVKTDRQVEGSKPRRRKTAAARVQPRPKFIGTRPRTFTMTLRGRAVDVEVIPTVGTTTHVNFEITFSRRGKTLDWVPTRAELDSIARVVATHVKQETSH